MEGGNVREKREAPFERRINTVSALTHTQLRNLVSKYTFQHSNI